MLRIFVVLVFATSIPVLHAQTPLPLTSCLDGIHGRLAQQQRLYRGVLFGRPDASEEPVGNTRYDEDGTPWIKTAPNIWRTAAPGLANNTWTDARMNQATEWEGMNDRVPASRSPRTGIFQTKRVLTSELVPHLTQSYRALGCRLAMVCEGARLSYAGEQGENGVLTVTTDGCEPMTMKPITSCSFETPADDEQTDAPENDRTLEALSDTIIRRDCEPLAQEILDREAAELRLAVGYDAAYRSLLQFAGAFDAFLSDFRDDFLSPLEQVMPLLSQLSRVPCFLAQCNE